ncbi:MAG: hypothetical protein FWD63_06880, partial [Propionibacteriaceae bacterium]|nr:hypothetical protein [Propionibacteriaceae bacterium]
MNTQICCLCRKPISGLGNKTLQDGARVCRSCVTHAEELDGDIDYDKLDEQQLRDLIDTLTQIQSVYDATIKDQVLLSQLFTQTRSFGPYNPAMVAADDKNRLFEFSIEPLMGWPDLRFIVLNFSDVIGAEAQRDGHVKVRTSVTGLPVVSIPTTVSVNYMGIGGWAAVRKSIQDPVAYNAAALAAQFINDTVHPGNSQADELIKWKSLLDSGGITPAEYD